MYQEITEDDAVVCIKKIDGENISWIPVNESNRMYQEYLSWKANAQS